MNIPLPIVFALGTALCWGLYGPVLGVARSEDPSHSPFKPYVGIGMAYLVWAIAGGLVGMWYNGVNFNFTGEAAKGSFLAFAAGSLGAFGALSLTMAMTTGGAKMPYVVMPVVFGGAVTVAALVSVVTSGAETRTSPWLWVGIAGILVCVLIVAYNTPHAPAKPATSPAAAGTEAVPESGRESVETAG